LANGNDSAVHIEFHANVSRVTKFMWQCAHAPIIMRGDENTQ
jgi:hypothetical protein